MRPLYVRLASAAIALSGCAKADHATSSGDDGIDIDASVSHDGPIGIDSGPGIDVPGGCTNMTTNLLANPALDGQPAGTGWQQMPIDAAAPIITDEQADLAPQSGTYLAWMGGYTRSSGNADSMYEDVAIPAGATGLELKGYYAVFTDEFLGGSYDMSTVELTSTSGTQLELIQSLDNNDDTSTWTAFSKTFTGNYGGMTVRLHFSTTGDDSYRTSFYFDSLELNATYCQ
jgi:hypothetical protein